MAAWVRSMKSSRVRNFGAASSFEDIGKPFHERDKNMLAIA